MDKEEAIKKLKMSIRNKRYEGGISIIQYDWFDTELKIDTLKVVLDEEYLKSMIRVININDVECREIYILVCGDVFDKSHDGERCDYFLSFDVDKNPVLLGGRDLETSNSFNLYGTNVYREIYLNLDKSINRNLLYADIFNHILL